MKKVKSLLILLVIISTTVRGNDEPSGETGNEKPKYVKPVVKGHHYFQETFEINNIGSKWIKSLAKKADVDEVIAKYEGEWSIEASADSALDGDKGLVLKSKAKHHAISARLLKPFDFKNNKPLIVQYEVKFQNALECGGAYIKLLTDSSDLKLETFLDKTPYTIMFGPDKCGAESKYHFIIRFKNPKTGEFEEKHAKKTENIDPFFNDGRTHLFTLIIHTDNRFQMFIDQNELNSGHLLNDLTPPINPEKEIVDPTDKKPENWDDREKIPDPDATKPDDWDENEPKTIVDENAVKPSGWLDEEQPTIPDPNAIKPEDWDDETDGEWEAPRLDNPVCKSAPGCGKWEPPMIDNPKYKGKWRPPMIDNPSYQGKWEPRKIPNPNYFEVTDPFKSLTSFSAVGLELWSMTDNIYFDNFLITDDESVANEFAKDSWLPKKTIESQKSKSGESVIDSLLNATRDKPWLWAVYVLVGLVPIVLVAVFCFGKSKPATSVDKKKTDEPTADDNASAQAAEGSNEPDEVQADEPEKAEEEIQNEEPELDGNRKKTKTASNESLDKAAGDTKDTKSPRKRRNNRKE